MSSSTRGRPRKRQRNVTGLLNSSSRELSLEFETQHHYSQASDRSRSRAPNPEYQQVYDLKDLASNEVEDSDDDYDEETDAEGYAGSEWDELEDEEFGKIWLQKMIFKKQRMP